MNVITRPIQVGFYMVYLALCSLICFACGDGALESNNRHTDEGSIAIRQAVWDVFRDNRVADGVKSALPISKAPAACSAYGITSVQGYVYDSSNTIVSSALELCEEGQMTLDNVPVGTVWILLEGEVGEAVEWRGQATGIDVYSGSTSDAGVITMVNIIDDTVRPQAQPDIPVHAASGVPLNTTISAIFSEDVYAGTVNSLTCFIEADGARIPSTVIYNSNTHKVSIDPVKQLARDTDYKVTLSTGVEDLAGNPMSDDMVWEFTTSPNYTITSTATSGGVISPSGAVSLNPGANQTFTITPDPSYIVTDVVVDNYSLGETDRYTFTNVTSDHTIHAVFALNSTDLQVTMQGDPDPVFAGDMLTYTIKVENLGIYPAENVVLSDAVPAQILNPVYSTDGGLVWQNWPGSLSLGAVPIDVSFEIQIKGEVASSFRGTLTNTAVVNSDTHDSNSDNNTVEEPTLVQEETVQSQDILIVHETAPLVYFGWYRASQMTEPGWELFQRAINWITDTAPANTTVILFTYDGTVSAEDGAAVYNYLADTGYHVAEVHHQSDIESLPSSYYADFDLAVYAHFYSRDASNIVNSGIPYITVATGQTDEMGIGTGVTTMHLARDTFSVVNNSHNITQPYPLGLLVFEESMWTDGTEASGSGISLISGQ